MRDQINPDHRQELHVAIVALLEKSICTDQFTALHCSGSSDRGVRAIWSHIYSLYSDDQNYRFDISSQPHEVQQLLDRCLLFLTTTYIYDIQDEAIWMLMRIRDVMLLLFLSMLAIFIITFTHAMIDLSVIVVCLELTVGSIILFLTISLHVKRKRLASSKGVSYWPFSSDDQYMRARMGRIGV
jgi:hypothetical protein